MKNNKYLIALKRLNMQLTEISKDYKTPKLFLIIHAAYCYLLYGSTPNDYIHFMFYKIKHIERKKYITRRKAIKFEKKLNAPENAVYFNNKWEFNKKFKNFVKRDWRFINEINENQFKEFVKKHKKIIIKPIDQSSGNGIKIYEYLNDNDLSILYDEIKMKNVLIEEVIKNCNDIATFNPSSCNTIRVYTLVERDNTVSIVNALIRIGAKNSVVDNYHSGGVGALIDIETGIICSQLVDVNAKRYIVHPTLKTEIIGKKIPRWGELKKNVIEAALVLPKSRWIAWDICITDYGFEYIEGNYDGDPGFLQAIDYVGKYYIVKEKI